ncbi:MAG TPA: ATP-dependent Clp protease adapter ClpS [Actinocrinis sp.]
MTTAPVEIERPEVDEATEPTVDAEKPWTTVVWNDPINLMSYVAYVFESYFGYPKSKARKLMLDVHQRGKAAVSKGTREEMERDVSAMHSYGLWATLQRA